MDGWGFLGIGIEFALVVIGNVIHIGGGKWAWPISFITTTTTTTTTTTILLCELHFSI